MSLCFTVIRSYWFIFFFYQETSSIVHLVEIVMYDIPYIICCLCQESLNLRRRKIIKSSLSHIVLLNDNCLCYKMCCFFFILKCSRLTVCWTLNPLQQTTVACCSVWHRTTVHLVILMWITSCKISWVFKVNCMVSSTVMWACYNVQHIVTNHSESQISQEGRAALPFLPSLVDDFTCVH